MLGRAMSWDDEWIDKEPLIGGAGTKGSDATDPSEIRVNAILASLAPDSTRVRLVGSPLI